jgi:hypothetical protein
MLFLLFFPPPKPLSPHSIVTHSSAPCSHLVMQLPQGNHCTARRSTHVRRSLVTGAALLRSSSLSPVIPPLSLSLSLFCIQFFITRAMLLCRQPRRSSPTAGRRRSSLARVHYTCGAPKHPCAAKPSPGHTRRPAAGEPSQLALRPLHLPRVWPWSS